jgi:hypothetical protein
MQSGRLQHLHLRELVRAQKLNPLLYTQMQGSNLSTTLLTIALNAALLSIAFRYLPLHISNFLTAPSTALPFLESSSTHFDVHFAASASTTQKPIQLIMVKRTRAAAVLTLQTTSDSLL